MLGMVQKTRRAIASALIWLLILNNVPMLSLVVKAQEGSLSDKDFYFTHTVSGNTVTGNEVSHTIDYTQEYKAKDIHRSDASVSGNASIVYSSSNPDIAEVIDEVNGKYKLIKAGEVDIIATQGEYTVSSGDQEMSFGMTESRYTLTINHIAQENFGFSENEIEDIYPDNGLYTIPEPIGGLGTGDITYELLGDKKGANINNNVIDFSECTLPCEVRVQAKKAGDDIYKEAVAETTICIITNPLNEFKFEKETDLKNFMWYLKYTLPNLEGNKGDGKVSYSLVDSENGFYLDEYNKDIHITGAGTVTVKATKEEDSKKHYAAKEAFFTLTVAWGMQGENDFSFMKNEEAIEEDKIIFDPEQTNTYEFIAKSTQSPAAVNYKIKSQSVSDMVDYNEEEGASLETQQMIINKPGEVIIEAKQEDGPNFWGETATLKLVVDKAEQEELTIKTSVANITYNDKQGNVITLGTNGGSVDGKVSYQILSQKIDGRESSDVVTLKDNVLTIHKAGEVELQAINAGDDYYKEAISEPFVFTIDKAAQAIKFKVESPLTFIYGTSDNYTNTACGVKIEGAWDDCGYDTKAKIQYEVLEGEEIATVSDDGTLTFLDGGIGTIKVGACIPEGDRYKSACTSYTMEVKYAEAPTATYFLKDDKGNLLKEADWFNHDVYIYPPDGYQISLTSKLSQDTWKECLVYDKEYAGSQTFYLREISSGAITGALSTGTIQVDRTKPYDLDIEYIGVAKTSNIQNTDYYSSQIEVTLSAKEDASGIKEFTYYLEDSEEGKKVDKLKFDGNKYTYTFTIEPQYKGKISFEATNTADITATYEDNQTIVLDNIAPLLEVEHSDWLLAANASNLSSLENHHESNGVEVNLYYNAEMTVTFKIEEENFEDVDVELIDCYNGEQHLLSTKGLWEEGEVANQWKLEYPLKGEGVHQLILKYQDRARNTPIYYRSEYIVIDNAAPTIDVDYVSAVDGSSGGVNQAGVMYYNSSQKATICITEENFRASDVKIQVTTTNAAGEVDVAKIQAYVNDPKNWSREGNVNKATIIFDVDANYDIRITYKDLANHEAEPCDEQFVIDKTLPMMQQLDFDKAYNSTKVCIGCVDENDKKIGIANADAQTRFIYDSQVTFRFAISELNFKPENVQVQVLKSDNTVLSSDKYTIIYEGMSEAQLHNFVVVLGSESQVPADDDYRVVINYTDMAGNPMKSQTSNVMTVDETAPTVKIKYAEETTSQTYYKGVRTAIITVTDRNVDLDNITVQVDAKDIEGNELAFDVAAEQSAWEPGSEPYTWESTITCDMDAHYIITATSTDMTGRTGQDTDAFILDNAAPDTGSFTFAYSEPLRRATYSNVEYKYYNSEVTITVTAEDLISPIASFECSYVRQQGASSLNSPGQTVTVIVPAEDIDYDNPSGKATATFTLSGAQYRGNISLRATDMAGNTSVARMDTSNVVVVDTVSPTRTITYSQAKHIVAKNTLNTVESFDYSSESAGVILYYNEPMTVSLRVEEANFYQADVSVKVNGSERTVNNWTQNGDVWTGSLTLAADGDYVVTMDYKDRSQNQMMSYVSDQITIDTTAPQIQVNYGPGDVVQQLSGVQYYDTEQTATITIAERNFRATDVEAVVTAKDVNGNNIAVMDYTSYLKNRSNWVKDGDKYTATIVYSTDANYTFDIGYTDLALRTAADYEQDVFTVDKTAPTNVSISYDTPIFETVLQAVTFGYYNAPITVTITAEDDVSGVYGFDYSYIKAAGVSSVNSASINGTIEEKDITFSNGKKTATASFTIPGTALNATKQINGNLEFAAYNRSLLRENQEDTKRLVIDNIAPTGKVEYSNCVRKVKDVSYYDGDINAVITIEEANFYAEAVEVSISKDGGELTPIEVDWQNETVDKHVGTFTLHEEGDYKVHITYQDPSTNKMKEYQSNQLTIDTTKPTIRLSGIKNHSANKQEKIGFVVTVEDTNLDAESFLQLLSAEVRAEDGTIQQVDMTQIGTVETVQEDNRCTYTITNIEQDGIYYFNCAVADLAGNETDGMIVEGSGGAPISSLIFSVNRNGSAYGLSEETKQLNNSFVKQPNDVVIYEINPNEITNIKITLFKNDKTIVLEEGKHYSITKDNEQGDWYKYAYTIFADSFIEDGIYRISIYSEDKAGNVAENTLDVKDMEISFGVDKTAPNLVVTNLESNTTYPLDKLSVMMQATDNMKLTNIKVDLDGKELASWNEEQIQQMSNNFEDYVFDIMGNETRAHTLTITLTDVAGNQLVEEITNFYVTTNLWVRYYNNKVLFYGSIIAGILSIFLIFLFWKRKKEQKEEEMQG